MRSFDSTEAAVPLRNQRTRGSDEFLIAEEVATRLRVKVSWVYSHADDLGAYRLGKYLRFSWDRVLDRLEELGRQPNDPD